MTQILVLYYSRSGNTKKLAEAVARGVKEVDNVNVVIKSAEEVTVNDFTQSHGIIAGSPVYFDRQHSPHNVSQRRPDRHER